MHAGTVRANLAGRFRDLDLADDAVGDALMAATETWTSDTVPRNPAAWLQTTARNKAIDRLRKAGRVDLIETDEPSTAGPETPQRDERGIIDADEGEDLGDQRLRLMLLCCHPAIRPSDQVALMLRLVAGLTTEEIAAAYVVPRETMVRRITRAKDKIRKARIPLTLGSRISEREHTALAGIYLIFNEGYLSRGSQRGAHAPDLCEEAIRLATIVTSTDDPSAEAIGLLALMLFVHARRDARVLNDEIVGLDDQDRTRWQLTDVHEGNRLLAAALAQMSPGPFQVQALIASHHSNARIAADTDWPAIVALYEQLQLLDTSPVIALNHAVAVGRADGPLAGLEALRSGEELDDYYAYHLAYADMLESIERYPDAAAAYTRALELTNNGAERVKLRARITALQP
ncbi:MAG: RNA polymerase sigma factor [Acidimicrobiales bacterium]